MTMLQRATNGSFAFGRNIRCRMNIETIQTKASDANPMARDMSPKAFQSSKPSFQAELAVLRSAYNTYACALANHLNNRARLLGAVRSSRDLRCKFCASH